MKALLFVCSSLLLVSCTTGIGKKISQNTLDEIQSGKGKLTRNEVRKKIGATPVAQLEREGYQCDSYTYTGMTNYFIFTKSEPGQSYNFCYDSKEVLNKVDGMTM